VQCAAAFAPYVRAGRACCWAGRINRDRKIWARLIPAGCGRSMMRLASGHERCRCSGVCLGLRSGGRVRSAWRGWPLDRRSATAGPGRGEWGVWSPFLYRRSAGSERPSPLLAQALEREARCEARSVGSREWGVGSRE
jgi:hypothetical protein